jgi:LmbE family N-acetylglucosaminyl deacetylase
MSAPLFLRRRGPSTMHPSIEIAAIQRALIVAPHPDDESLGCGGLLALLAQQKCEVMVLFVTDGGASHRHSRLWPRQRLAALRRAEAAAALAELGLGNAQREFLNLRDADMPMPASKEWRSAVARVTQIVERMRPELVVLPWRRDPHCDHRASWQLMDHTMGGAFRPIMLEYAVWLDEIGAPDDHPRPGEAQMVAVDIAQTAAAKKRAVALHLSQTTALIEDDPDGFCLSRTTIERLTGPVERYWQVHDAAN